MACEFIAGDGVLVAVWGRATKDDVDRGVGHLESMSSLRGGPIIYITRVPVDAPTPDSAVRQYLNSMMPKIISMCSSYHVILEGTGFTAALKRGVLVSFFQIGRRRNLFFVHSQADEVLANIPSERHLSVRALLVRAVGRGLLHGAQPTSLLPVDKYAARAKRSGIRSTRDFPEDIFNSNVR